MPYGRKRKNLEDYWTFEKKLRTTKNFSGENCMIDFRVDNVEILKCFPILNVNDPDGERKTYKLTNFTLYQKNEDLCAVDDVENKKLDVYMSGNVKNIIDDDPELKDSVPINNIKINSVWIYGYTKDEKMGIGLSTSNNVDFFLLKPSRRYEKMFSEFFCKAFTAKTVVDILLDDPQSSYDDVINYLNCDYDEIVKKYFSEQFIIDNAKFLINHIYSYDDGGDEDEFVKLMDTDFVKTLCEPYGIEIEDDSERIRRKFERKQNLNVKAFVTRIVRKVFEKMESFRSKIRNSVDEDDDQNINDKHDEIQTKIKRPNNERCFVSQFFDDDCVSSNLLDVQQKSYWSIDETSWMLDKCGVKCFTNLHSTPNSVLRKGDFVSFNAIALPDQKMFQLLGRVNYFTRDAELAGNIFAHVSWLLPSNETLLDELADDREYFFVGRCENVNVRRIVKKEEIQFLPILSDWKDFGGINDENLSPKRQFVRQWYDSYKPSFYYPHSRVPDPICPDCDKIDDEQVDEDHAKSRFVPLRTFDVFGGCGGLSEGLRQSNVVEICWSVEIDRDAAVSFEINHKSATVFNVNASDLLQAATENRSDINGKLIPSPGEVDLIVGGPPCQGFSHLNRHQLSENSQYKNSCIMPFCGFIEFYRPRFVVMESVIAFAQFNESSVLKSVFQFLTTLGYQCTFGILQAGSFGVPQNRRRFFILAAAPDEILPNFPSPTHEFPKSYLNITVSVGDKCFTPPEFFLSSNGHLLPSVTVSDALQGLPPIERERVEKANNNYVNCARIGTYDERMRNRGTILVDHVCRPVSPLNFKRITLIPKFPFGHDWLELLKVNDTITYTYFDENDETQIGGCLNIRECPCKIPAAVKEIREGKNLIPLYLLHGWFCKNERNLGTFGRVKLDGYFDTLTTSALPSAKQGRVLHPDEDRTLSVREYARAQGFYDTYQIHGEHISSKYRQIGNAVPPPLSRAIGREIRHSVVRRRNV